MYGCDGCVGRPAPVGVRVMLSTKREPCEERSAGQKLGCGDAREILGWWGNLLEFCDTAADARFDVEGQGEVGECALEVSSGCDGCWVEDVGQAVERQRFKGYFVNGQGLEKDDEQIRCICEVFGLRALEIDGY